MPRDPAIRKVLVIGAGPIIIGQGCEFDYSGTQACLALKEEGCQVILLNSNPATIMTDPETADHVYIEPITVDTVEGILEKHCPDSLLPTMGGQTALNLTVELAKKGILDKYGVKVVGLTLDSIQLAEDRALFKKTMEAIGVDIPPSVPVNSWEEALAALERIRFPLVVRCSYALGGHGGGIAYHLKDLEALCVSALPHTVLLEEFLVNWKEFELEAMRDSAGNCIVVCGIENIDPMGVHTGDSITVAPIQTLTDKEYQKMRQTAFQVMEAIGITSGGCNVQFAVHPETGRMVCIEINPRVSRSSALASKATGFPIAKAAAKIALGYHLNELRAAYFPASYEPVIDYVVTKIPRFDFEKFPKADRKLTIRMKSTGEVMAIGRTFKESFNKAISSLDAAYAAEDYTTLLEQLKHPCPGRLRLAQIALSQGISVDTIHTITGYDRWFLYHLLELVEDERAIAAADFDQVDQPQLLRWKKMGFSDAAIAAVLDCTEKELADKRMAFNIHPVYKCVDSCSGEFPNDLSAMYSSYGEECESPPSQRPKILILGSGPNRIGQGIEFDYCCVHAIKAVKAMGYESVVINCNPETVSTDYDLADRLYIEPLTFEYVLEVVRREQPMGVLAQFGGQTALNLGKQLYKEGVLLLGTPFSSINIAEDRAEFRSFIAELGFNQPQSCSCATPAEAVCFAKELGYPLICRPSHVIGGTSMQVVHNHNELHAYLDDDPMKYRGAILVEKFLEGALEVEVDAISDGEEVFICGIVEHIEPAGVHSGDSMSYLSPYSLDEKLQQDLIDQTKAIAYSLKIVGLFNLQFVISGGRSYIIEANLRASRTVPPLSKTTRLPLVRIATNCILGSSLKEQGFLGRAPSEIFGLKLPVFPFEGLHVDDIILGPQMKSIGEVLCMGQSFEEVSHKANSYANRSCCINYHQASELTENS